MTNRNIQSFHRTRVVSQNYLNSTTPAPPYQAQAPRHHRDARLVNDVRRFHAVAAQVGRVDLRGQHPGKAGVGAEEAFVDDEAGDVDAFGRAGVFLRVHDVGAADDEEADEEAGEHGAGPEAPAEALHVEDGGDSAEEEGAAADKGHEDGMLAVEADLVHQGCHVVPA